MILLPQRLFDAPNVSVLLRDGNVCILKKVLSKPTLDTEGYISNHVIAILLSGEQRIRTYDNETITIKAKEILFIPRGMYYITDLIPNQSTFESLLFYFDDSIIQEFLSNSTVTEVSRKDTPSHLKFGIVPSIDVFAESLINIYQSPQLRNTNFLHLKILELLYLLNGFSEETSFANFLFRLTLPQKRNIKTFMERNFDKPLKIEDYAYLTGRSLSTFRRDFKSQFNITPQKWLKERRMERAIIILKKGEISVTELAYEVGYENISYFIKEFKLQYGQSPKQYMLSKRRNHLSN